MNEEKLLRYVSMAFMTVVCGYIFYSLFQFVFTKNIPLFSITSPLVFAFLVGIVLFICIILNAIREFRIIKEMNREKAEKTMSFTELFKVLGGILIILLYVFFMRKFSFRPVTIVYLFITMFLLNQLQENLSKKIVKAALAAIITVPVIYYIFNGIFLVMLP